MNVYNLIKLNRFLKNPRIKNLGIWVLHITGKRYFGVFLDPVFACNLRCKMCYFSDDKIRKAKQTRALTDEEISRISEAFFHRALKLQIGCGAEPSLYPKNKEIIRLAKEKKVPYISMTTNANLFSENDWRELVEAGLDEVTISLHGVNRETYEFFMTNGSYDKFLSSLQALTLLKNEYPLFKLRINYTINKDNLTELATFFDVFGKYTFDILQVRPIQELGETDYADFSWDAIVAQYDSVIGHLRQEAARRDVVFIAPSLNDLLKEDNEDSSVADSTYFYINSRQFWQPDFDIQTDTYESYAKRGWDKSLLKKVFQSKRGMTKTKKNLNYEIN